jgi:citrate lyase beta subunit
MKTTLSSDDIQKQFGPLIDGERRFNQRFPGDSGARQPVHTVYGGAHLFKADTAKKLGGLALRSLDAYGPDPITFARAVGLPGSEHLPADHSEGRAMAEAALQNAAANRPAWLAVTVYDRIREKLAKEPVEDFRIDFEDGYGNRPDDEEDGHAVAAATELARGIAERTLPPFVGIRVKPLSSELRTRSVRTLDLFITQLVAQSGGKLPDNFVVTLPKVVMSEQVAAFAGLLGSLESRLGLGSGALRLELMIEQTQAIIGPDGLATLPRLIDAGGGRCVSAHFGTYDYTASCDITAAYQSITHPVCDFAKHIMQVTLAGTGIWISDGATNIMPIAPHVAAKQGPPLTPRQIAENVEWVHRAWRLHYDHARHSLVGGFYQGWDLHPAQLPTRYAAVYAFFLQGLDTASDRLRNFVNRAAQATLVGDVFDDAATGQGLLNFFLRAKNCGALTEQEAVDKSGLTADELRSRSFVKILDGRRKQ